MNPNTAFQLIEQFRDIERNGVKCSTDTLNWVFGDNVHFTQSNFSTLCVKDAKCPIVVDIPQAFNNDCF